MTPEKSCNKAFGHHQMGRLLGRIGSMLPQWLDGTELAQAARDIERMCWRELGYRKAPLFPGDVPPFLLRDENGRPTGEPLQEPISPRELASRLAALPPSVPPGPSPLERNFQMLACLLNLTPAESEWVLWSDCFTRFTPPPLPCAPQTTPSRSWLKSWPYLPTKSGVANPLTDSRPWDF